MITTSTWREVTIWPTGELDEQRPMFLAREVRNPGHVTRTALGAESVLTPESPGRSNERPASAS